MEKYEVTLIALDIRRWDLESMRLSLTTYYVIQDEEKSQQLELSITQPPEMVEEFLGKIRVGCEKKLRNSDHEDLEFEVLMNNETFLRQKLYNYFRRILGELNNPKRKKGYPKMIFTTHLDIYNENQDISFLPPVIQFYVVLNWARKYYEKEDYQKAIEPLKKLIEIRPDYGKGYKWLARSLKKIRKYDEAMRYYEKYAEVDGSLDSLLDLAKSYRKGKVFDKSEEIYRDILEKYPGEKEARIGLAQIRYARNEDGYLEMLDELYQEDPEWVKKWLLEEFNFRIYVTRKTPFTPVQAARYLGFEKVFELTQKAFRNEVPSHFNPNLARIRFYKEELDNWAMIMNRYHCYPEDIVLHPDQVEIGEAQPVDEEEDDEIKFTNGERDDQADKQARPAKRATSVEEILKKIRATKAVNSIPAEAAARNAAAEKAASGTENSGEPVRRKRGRPPKKKKEEQATASAAETTPKAAAEQGENPPAETPKRKRGRPRKNPPPQNNEENKSTLSPPSALKEEAKAASGDGLKKLPEKPEPLPGNKGSLS